MDSVCVPAAVESGRFPRGRMAPLYAAATRLLGPANDDAVAVPPPGNTLPPMSFQEGLQVSGTFISIPGLQKLRVNILSSISARDAGSGKDKQYVDPLRQKVFGDGRCAFRALARAAFPELLNSCKRDSDGSALDARVRADERQLADLLRLEVVRYFRNHPKEMACLVDTSDLDAYIESLSEASTWAGEPELYVAAKHVLDRVVEVWILERRPLEEGLGEGLGEGWGEGWGKVKVQPKCIQRYEPEGAGRKLQPLRLLYNGRDHWDLFVGPSKNWPSRCGVKDCTSRSRLRLALLQPGRRMGSCLPS